MELYIAYGNNAGRGMLTEFHGDGRTEKNTLLALMAETVRGEI